MAELERAAADFFFIHVFDIGRHVNDHYVRIRDVAKGRLHKMFEYPVINTRIPQQKFIRIKGSFSFQLKKGGRWKEGSKGNHF